MKYIRLDLPTSDFSVALFGWSSHCRIALPESDFNEVSQRFFLASSRLQTAGRHLVFECQKIGSFFLAVLWNTAHTRPRPSSLLCYISENNPGAIRHGRLDGLCLWRAMQGSQSTAFSEKSSVSSVLWLKARSTAVMFTRLLKFDFGNSYVLPKPKPGTRCCSLLCAQVHNIKTQYEENLLRNGADWEIFNHPRDTSLSFCLHYHHQSWLQAHHVTEGSSSLPSWWPRTKDEFLLGCVTRRWRGCD